VTPMTTVGIGTWTADLTRTQAAFAARHFFGQTVHGTIAVTAGTVEVGPDGQPRRLHAALAPATISTGHSRRDADLRGKRFLAAGSYPLMEVAASRISATDGGWHADAVLRVHGCEVPLRIAATLDGPADGARLRVNGTARLDLRAAGIRVPGFLVRRFVDLTVSAELTRDT
jgi:polyisoprenoid-binding protein YceI